MTDSPLLAAVRARRVLLCVGAGGVGKTTVSASLALLGAHEERRSLVCTIDPAKRLASALGLRQLGNNVAPIPPEQLAAAGLPKDLPLFAMMLDMKQTWDDFIERHASPEDRQKIFSNRFYRSLSSVLAGSQEYIAMEKLWQLRQERDYPLVVLDTPPASHALDFLDAPGRVLGFLGGEAARLLLAPAVAAGKLGLSLFKRGGFVARSLARFTGTEMLQELANFMLVLGGLEGSFRTRARQVQELLLDPGTAFVIVTSPAPERLAEALRLHAHLREHGYPVAAVVANRTHRPPPSGLDGELAGMRSDLRQKVERTRDEQRAQAARDHEGLTALARAVAPTPLVQVPQMSADVHELRGLEETARYLAGEQPG
jgi:anion-transporting  ArsA/GET3 family ATPase